MREEKIMLQCRKGNWPSLGIELATSCSYALSYGSFSRDHDTSCFHSVEEEDF